MSGLEVYPSNHPLDAGQTRRDLFASRCSRNKMFPPAPTGKLKNRKKTQPRARALRRLAVLGSDCELAGCADQFPGDARVGCVVACVVNDHKLGAWPHALELPRPADRCL